MSTLVHNVVLLLLVSATLACSDDLPVVAHGRYVEIATEREDVICGGTVAYTDRYLDVAFGAIDASAPERRFVRYEWVEPTSSDGTAGGRARRDGDSTVITTSRLLDEHELAHAVHHHGLPTSRPVLYEGFAVLLDSHTGIGQDRWPAGEPLDPLLEDGSIDRSGYPLAWFFVSQIVRDHGMEGLRDFWHQVPPDASATEARTAYQALFGRPIEALIEPYEASAGGPLLERWSCYSTVFCGEPIPWSGSTWQAEGPFACEDDPDALGPMGISGTGTIERYHVVELEPSTSYRFTASGGVGARVRPCELQCLPGAAVSSYWPDMPITSTTLMGGRHRVEILAELEELPTATPGTFTIERLD